MSDKTTRTDDFNVVVTAGVETALPNGSTILVRGTGGNYEVRGMSTEHDGPVVEVVGYQCSGLPMAEADARSCLPD